jgi:benzil reductase ((S)-benzoin forming)
MQAHIRTAEAEQFSEREKFASLHAEEKLRSPTEVAEAILVWLAEPKQPQSSSVARLQ